MSCPFKSADDVGAKIEIPPYTDTGQSPMQQQTVAFRSLRDHQSEEEDDVMLWPTLTEVAAEVSSADYNMILENKEDFKSGEAAATKSKVLCANGYVAGVRIEWFGDHLPYTGLFQGADYGIIRLSTALNVLPNTLPWYAGSIANSQIFPCVAMKFFRRGAHSGNLLFAGKKTGQANRKFFHLPVATNITEKMSMVMGWAYSVFKRFSAYPNQLGISDFAAFDQFGNSRIPSGGIQFPWCIGLIPNPDLAGVDFESIPEQLHAGAVLYDVCAFSTPSAAAESEGCGLERLGRVIITTEFISSPARSSVFFKHQRKEEDYELRPDWLRDLSPDLLNVGSSFFSKVLEKGNFKDFEVRN